MKAKKKQLKKRIKKTKEKIGKKESGNKEK